jgi:transposase
MDLGRAYQSATDKRAPHAMQCVDPFHLVKLANKAVDDARLWAWNEERRRHPAQRRPMGRPRKDAPPPARNQTRFVKHTRWALLKDPEHLLDSQLAVLHELRRSGSALFRCWQLKEGVRDLYRVRPKDAAEHLAWWLAWASRSRIPSFVQLAKTVRANRQRILAAIELGLSNSKLEGMNSKIRLIKNRGYGHHSATALIAMIYLCCGRIVVELPTDRVPALPK